MIFLMHQLSSDHFERLGMNKHVFVRYVFRMETFLFGVIGQAAPGTIMNQFMYLMVHMSAVWFDSVKLGADDLMGQMYVHILEIFWKSSRSGSISVRTTN